MSKKVKSQDKQLTNSKKSIKKNTSKKSIDIIKINNFILKNELNMSRTEILKQKEIIMNILRKFILTNIDMDIFKNSIKLRFECFVYKNLAHLIILINNNHIFKFIQTKDDYDGNFIMFFTEIILCIIYIMKSILIHVSNVIHPIYVNIGMMQGKEISAYNIESINTQLSYLDIVGKNITFYYLNARYVINYLTNLEINDIKFKDK